MSLCSRLVQLPRHMRAKKIEERKNISDQNRNELQNYFMEAVKLQNLENNKEDQPLPKSEEEVVWQNEFKGSTCSDCSFTLNLQPFIQKESQKNPLHSLSCIESWKTELQESQRNQVTAFYYLVSSCFSWNTWRSLVAGTSSLGLSTITARTRPLLANEAIGNTSNFEQNHGISIRILRSDGNFQFQLTWILLISSNNSQQISVKSVHH